MGYTVGQLEAIGGLRACAKDLGTNRLTQSGYDRWARRMPAGSSRVACRRFGDWSRAVEAADLEHGRIPTRLSLEDAAAHLRFAASALETGTLLRQAYDRWRAARPDPAPPLATTIDRKVGWGQAMAAAGLTARATGRPAADEAQLVDAVRRALHVQADNRLSAPAYDEWRRVHAPDASTAETISRALVWDEAVTLAGGTSGRWFRYRRDELVNAIVEAARHYRQGQLTIEEYNAWRSTECPAAPSGPTTTISLWIEG